MNDKLKAHLKHYANELSEYGNIAESNFIMNEILPFVDKKVLEYNERGKMNILELLNKPVKQCYNNSCYCTGDCQRAKQSFSKSLEVIYRNDV